MPRAGDILDRTGREGAGLAGYGYAFLLFMLPHSLVTVSLVTALFTRISVSAHREDTDEVVSDLGRGLGMPAVLLLPVAVLAGVLRTQAVRVAFFGNSQAETVAIAHVMIAIRVGLVPFGWLYLLQRVYSAYEAAVTPFRPQAL